MKHRCFPKRKNVQFCYWFPKISYPFSIIWNIRYLTDPGSGFFRQKKIGYLFFHKKVHLYPKILVSSPLEVCHNLRYCMIWSPTPFKGPVLSRSLTMIPDLVTETVRHLPSWVQTVGRVMCASSLDNLLCLFMVTSPYFYTQTHTKPWQWEFASAPSKTTLKDNAYGIKSSPYRPQHILPTPLGAGFFLAREGWLAETIDLTFLRKIGTWLD